MTESRHTLLPAMRQMVPLAVVCALVGALVSTTGAWRTSFAALGAAWGLAWGVLRHRRPELVLSADEYRVEVAGTVRFRVGWSEVLRIYHDPGEHAVYVDCGDPARNLLVPPERGFGFTFTGRKQLYQSLLAAAPDRVQQVENLDSVVNQDQPASK